MVNETEFDEILEELVAELPERFFHQLNGGVFRVTECKENPIGNSHDLYILGEYHIRGIWGRWIDIYYGSFMRLYGFMDKEPLKQEMRKVLRHEFRHHLESLAGERDLEVEDAIFLRNYLRKREKAVTESLEE